MTAETQNNRHIAGVQAIVEHHRAVTDVIASAMSDYASSATGSSWNKACFAFEASAVFSALHRAGHLNFSTATPADVAGPFTIVDVGEIAEGVHGVVLDGHLGAIRRAATLLHEPVSLLPTSTLLSLSARCGEMERALEKAEQQIDYGQVDAAHQIILRALSRRATGGEHG